jgi:class 3 adenylate cyclase
MERVLSVQAIAASLTLEPQHNFLDIVSKVLSASNRSHLGERDSQIATLEPAPEDGLSPFEFPTDQMNDLSTESGGVTDTALLELMGLHSDEQLALEPTRRCPVAWAAYQWSWCMLNVIRPFLSHTTWREAVEVVRRGGRSLPTETRQVSILWLDIADFTELVDSHPLDEVLSALNDYLNTLTQLVYRHQGDVNKYLGDGFLGVFVDANDAVKAGCAIQQAAGNFNRRQSARSELVFPTRVGIDTGQVAIVSLGPHNRQDRTVLGMPVNLAKRLQEKAPPGEVWLSQATFDRLSDQSGCRCLGPVEIRGRQEPVVVYGKR